MNRSLVCMLFLLIHFASTFSIFPEKIIGLTENGHWETILICSLLEIAVLWFYLKALAVFPGENIIDICKRTVGSWGTRIIMLPFVLFLFFYFILLGYYEALEIKAVMLPKTPISASLLVFILLALYAAWKGIDVIVRASMVLFVIFIPFVLFSLAISIKNFDFHNMFPIWNASPAFLMKPDFYVSLLGNSGFLVIGMLSLDKPMQFRQILPIMLVVTLFALFTVYVPLLVFGREVAVNLQYPTLMASDTIDIEWVVFDWLPTFYSVSSGALNVFQASAMLWTMAKIIRLSYFQIREGWIVLSLSAILYILCLNISNMRALNDFLALNSWLCMYSIIFIPFIVAILAAKGQRRSKT